MKQQTAMLIATLVIVAAVAVILATRKDLYEVRFRSGQTEVAVFMGYEPK